jgi:ubiquinone/menaquinone biosynthesis C-methylase UbiE
MADARDEGCWTNHAKEHIPLKEYDFKEGDKFRPIFRRAEGVKRVLDIGCGSGLWAKLFLEAGDVEYVGLDQNAAMLEVARNRYPGVEFVHSNGRAMPFADGSFDLVFTAAVLQHNRHIPDKEELAEEIKRIIRPKGYYLCTENTFREDNYRIVFGSTSLFSDDLTDGYTFTTKGWEDFFNQYGFELIYFENPSEYLFRKKQ